MIMIMLNLLLIISSIMFSQMKHPLAMGFMLLIQTVLISLITGMMINSFWFSYILFLVFLGGMLVLFIYVTSLASNEMFKFSIKLMIIYMIIFMLSMTSIFLVDLINHLDIFNYEANNISFMTYMKENINLIYKLYNFPTNWLTCLMINYLFFALIVIVKITSFFYGPIRNLN